MIEKYSHYDNDHNNYHNNHVNDNNNNYYYRGSARDYYRGYEEECQQGGQKDPDLPRRSEGEDELNLHYHRLLDNNDCRIHH